MINNLFGKNPSDKDQQSQNDKTLRKARREFERERRKLEMEEKKLQIEIKKNAEAGYNEAFSLLAKQLVELRKQKNRSYAANSKILNVSLKNRVFGAHTSLSRDMATAVKTMGEMNTMIQSERISGNMRAFQKAYLKMDTTDELKYTPNKIPLISTGMFRIILILIITVIMGVVLYNFKV